MKTIMRTILVLMITAIFATGYFTSTGVYNMAATEKHWFVTEKLIEWMRINSIAVRADELEIPEMDEESYLSIGAVHYEAMCVVCHLSPGQQPTELAQGLYPQAPVFYQQTPLLNDPDAQQAQSRAYFWVIKNGIKMTAMPAWGLTHDDESIWAMAFFVQRLAGMSADAYRNLIDSQDVGHGHTHDDAHAHGHDHGHVDNNETDRDHLHEHATDPHDDAAHSSHTHDTTVEAHDN